LKKANSKKDVIEYRKEEQDNHSKENSIAFSSQEENTGHIFDDIEKIKDIEPFYLKVPHHFHFFRHDERLKTL
jgi:hypothetical protein